MMTPLAKANTELFQRYKAIILKCDPDSDPYQDDPRLSMENLAWMCTEAISCAAALPDDKASRWLGFVQGCLAMRGLIDVDEEREISRPLFHGAAAEMGQTIPKTRARS